MSFPVAADPVVALAAAKRVLTEQGYVVISSGQPAGSFTTAPLHKRLSMKEADCGRKWGIPYLLDGRTKTNISLTVVASGGEMKLSSGILGVMKVGMGADDIALTCTSKGVLEANMAQAIKAAM